MNASPSQLTQITDLIVSVRHHNPEHADQISHAIDAIPTIPAVLADMFIRGLSDYVNYYHQDQDQQD